MGAKRFEGKVALVTGAASGIGRAIALRLAGERARVGLVDLNEAGLLRVADGICGSGGEAMALGLDVTTEGCWETAMNRLLTKWRRLDLCINCAGIAYDSPIVEIKLKDWHRVMATNLASVFLGTKHALRVMTERGGGCIVNIASAAGVKALPGNAAYGTSKAAIRFFTRIAALEGAPHHVRVNSISPGAVATSMWEGSAAWPSEAAETAGPEAALQALVQERGFAEPEEIAVAVLFLGSEDGRHITGTDLLIDDGFAIT